MRGLNQHCIPMSSFSILSNSWLCCSHCPPSNSSGIHFPPQWAGLGHQTDRKASIKVFPSVPIILELPKWQKTMPGGVQATTHSCPKSSESSEQCWYSPELQESSTSSLRRYVRLFHQQNTWSNLGAGNSGSHLMEMSHREMLWTKGGHPRIPSELG